MLKEVVMADKKEKYRASWLEVVLMVIVTFFIALTYTIVWVLFT